MKSPFYYPSPQAPTDIVSRGFDLSSYIGCGNNYVSTANVHEATSSLTITNVNIGNTFVVFNVTGGVSGVEYLIENQVVFESGNQETFTAILTIIQPAGFSSAGGPPSNSNSTESFAGNEIVNSLTSNTFISGSSLQVSGPVVGNGYMQTGNVLTTTSGNTIVVDSWLTNQYRTVEYLAQVTDNTPGANQFYSAQFVVTHDGPSDPATYIAQNVYVSSYNVVYSDGASNLGLFNPNLTSNGTTVTVTFSPSAASNKTIRIARLCIPV